MVSKLVVGNWKMNGRFADNAALVGGLTAAAPKGVGMAVCVPFPYLAQVQDLLANSAIALGAQDVSAQAEGAYTGQVSAGMLQEFGTTFVIVGHSERRSQLGEQDAEVAAKAAAALTAGIRPIVCVGESLEQRDAGRVREVVEQQLDALDGQVAAEELGRVVIAYEPVWAIGTGRSAAPEQVQDVLALIRAWLAQRTPAARSTQVLYGGSVKARGAAELFSLPDCDGGLIGGASLLAEEFIAICQAAAQPV